jgi:hypothetical protein
MTTHRTTARRQFTIPIVREIARRKPEMEPPPDNGAAAARQRRLVIASLVLDPGGRR